MPRAFRPILSSRSSRYLLGAFLLLGSGTCTDGTHLPSEGGGIQNQGLAVRPEFSFQGVESEGQSDALNAAFDRVDRFRVVFKRTPGGEVAADVVISVSPGQGQYSISVDVSLRQPGEVFAAELTALQGDTPLFQAEPFQVKAPTTGSSSSVPTLVTLVYSGPGFDATELRFESAGAALPPGGTEQLSVQVMGPGGSAVQGVPLSWSSGAPSVASVSSSGLVTAGGTGLARITVTAPTGLEASTWIYVVDGELAYAREGHVFVAPILGGTGEDRTPGAQSASAPTWSPDGSRLLYQEGGSIREVGGSGSLVGGSWVAISPDGSRLALEVDGTIYFSNDDGSLLTQGPSGSAPQWFWDGEHLAVEGGSIQKVRADGTGRNILAGGAGAKLPALSIPTGNLAYLNDSDGDGVGALWATGPEGGLPRELIPESTGIRGRPTWSPGEEWVLAEAGSGDGFYLAPASGAGPAILLAGPDGASDPAWKPGGPMASPPALFLTAMDPPNPGPGEEVEVSGGGFDWIIPENNRVYFPGPGGQTEGDLLEVEGDRLLVQVPEVVSSGTLTVMNRTREATMAFAPAPGKLTVAVTKGPETGLEGIPVFLSFGGSTTATATTDESGQAVFSNLLEGVYGVLITVPEGFTLQGENPVTVSMVAGTSPRVGFVLDPEIWSVTLDPEIPSVEVGSFLDVEVILQDIQEDPISPEGHQILFSAGSTQFTVTGSGPVGRMMGVYPCVSARCGELRVNVDNVVHFFQATVTSFISGTAVDEGGAGVGNIQMELSSGGSSLATAVTDVEGGYTFPDLLQGTYTVTPDPPEGFLADPPSETLTLSQGTPTGSADFLLYPGGGPVFTGDLTIDSPGALEAFYQAGYQEVTGTLTISGTTLVSLGGMESLLSVGGDLVFSGSLSSLTSLAGLSGLRTVGGWVTGVSVFPGMNVQFPALESVGGFHLQSCSLSGIGLPVLGTVTDHFELVTNTITGNVVVASDATFTAVNGVWLDGNTGSFTLSVPGLLDPGTNFRLQNNPGLLSVAATTGVASASNVADYDFLNNSNLASISFPNLVQISEMEIYNSPDLQVVDFPRLALSTNSSIHIVGNGTPGIPLILNFPLLQSVGTNLEIGGAGGDMGALNFPALSTVPNSLWITNSTGLTAVSFPLLTSAGYVEVQDNADLTGFTAPNLASVGTDVMVRNNASLTTFDLGGLSSIDYFTIRDNPALTTFLAGSLVTAFDLEVNGNGALTGWDLSSLASGRISIVSQPALISLPSLPAAGSGLDVYMDTNLNLADLAGLSGATQLGSLVMYLHPALSDLSGLSALQTVAGVLIIDDADALTSITLPNLNQAQDIDLARHDNLTSISFPSLTLVGSMRLAWMGLITGVSLPSLTSLTDELLVGFTSLTNLDPFSGIVSPLNNVLVANNPSLTDVSGLSGIGDTFANPAVSGSFVIQDNPNMCADYVDDLIAIIEAKNPGGAFASPPVNSNNTGTCLVPVPEEPELSDSSDLPQLFLWEGGE